MKKLLPVIAVILAVMIAAAGCGAAAGQKAETVSGPAAAEAEGEAVSEAADEQNPMKSEELTQKLTASLEEDESQEEPEDENYVPEGGDVAVLTGSGAIDDRGYIQAIYEGVRKYAWAAGVTYSVYGSTEGEKDSFIGALDQAVNSGASLIVCASEEFFELMSKYPGQYPELNFLLIDGQPRDENGNSTDISGNVHCVVFREEVAGYLAGYVSVLDGYRELGFIGGEEVEAVKAYGYGYLRGIEAAVKELKSEGEDIADQVKVRYVYSGTFSASDEIYDLAAGWYEDGTEVIFACGGKIYEPILRAAEEGDKWMIGVDVDQNDLSDHVLTSARKGIDQAVVTILDEYYAAGGSWPEEFAGTASVYGPEKWCGDLTPSEDSWRFENVSLEEYWNYYMTVHQGAVEISGDISKVPAVSYELVME